MSEYLNVNNLLNLVMDGQMLSQKDLSNLLSSSPPTLSNWQKNGVNPERGGGPYLLFRSVIALYKQIIREPEMMNDKLVRECIRLGAKKTLHLHFEPYKDRMDGDFYEFIKEGSLIGVLFALLFDSYISKQKGQIPPSRYILDSGTLPSRADDEETLVKAMFDQDRAMKLLDELRKTRDSNRE